MKTSERREIMLKHRQRHIEGLQKLGYIHNTTHAIKRLENDANKIQVADCNGELTEVEASDDTLDDDEVEEEYIKGRGNYPW